MHLELSLTLLSLTLTTHSQKVGCLRQVFTKIIQNCKSLYTNVLFMLLLSANIMNLIYMNNMETDLFAKEILYI